MPLVAIALRAALRIVNVAALLLAAEDDVKRRVIPNVLAVIVLGAGISLRLLSDAGAMWLSILAGAAVYVALAALVHAGAIGGADAKLTAAASFLVPADRVPVLLVDIALAGGVLGIAWLAVRRLWPTITATLPYGVAICAGSTYRMMADLCSRSDAISFWR